MCSSQVYITYRYPGQSRIFTLCSQNFNDDDNFNLNLYRSDSISVNGYDRLGRAGISSIKSFDPHSNFLSELKLNMNKKRFFFNPISCGLSINDTTIIKENSRIVNLSKL